MFLLNVYNGVCLAVLRAARQARGVGFNPLKPGGTFGQTLRVEGRPSRQATTSPTLEEKDSPRRLKPHTRDGPTGEKNRCSRSWTIRLEYRDERKFVGGLTE